MRHSFKVVLILLFISSTAFSQWTGLTCGGIYFSTSGNRLFANPGVHVSTDFGNTWTDLGLDSCNILTVVQSGSKLFAGGWCGVYFSSDNGQTWTSASNGIPSNLSILTLCVNGNDVFAGSEGGIYHTTNNGVNWTSALNNFSIRSILLKDNILFAATFGGGVYVSTNNGLSWSSANNGIPTIYLFARSLATNGVNIYCGCHGGVLLSTNNGASWTVISSGQDVFGITVSGNNLFEGDFQENGLICRVHYSSNNGQNWLNVTSNLNGAWLWNMSSLGDYVFVSATTGWRRSISEITGIVSLNEKIPSGFSLYQNYPNPFNPSTKIKIDIPAGINGKASKVNLVVYDELGKEAATLINGEYKPGSYEVEWDASNFPSGVYFYKLVTNEFTDTKKMVLMK